MSAKSSAMDAASTRSTYRASDTRCSSNNAGQNCSSAFDMEKMTATLRSMTSTAIVSSSFELEPPAMRDRRRPGIHDADLRWDFGATLANILPCRFLSDHGGGRLL